MSDNNETRYVEANELDETHSNQNDWMAVRRNILTDMLYRPIDRNSREYRYKIGILGVIWLYTFIGLCISVSMKCSGTYNMNKVYIYFLLYLYLKYKSIQPTYSTRTIQRVVFFREMLFLLTNVSLIDSAYQYYYRVGSTSQVCNVLTIINLVFYITYMYLPTIIILFVLCFFLPQAIRMRRQQYSSLTVDKINKIIPTRRCEASDQGKNCTICLEDFNLGEHIRSLTCNHIYHKDCIDDWLTRNNSCPVCRQEAVSIPNQSSALDSV
jgi:hypothetical protein